MLPILIILGVAGFAVGGQINRAIYRWAWNQRAISPWSTAPEGVAARTWADRVPVFGWWPMRRESKVHGTAFWLRPMMIELAFGIGLAALYWWEVGVMGWEMSRFCAHAILFALMMIATFIDFDEKTIPDFVTVPGTIIALLFAAFLPSSLPPVPPMPMGPVLTTTPFEWPIWLDGVKGLGIGLACWFAWCAALLPRTVYFRRGIVKGFQFLSASLVRFPVSKWIGVMSLVGASTISAVWFAMSGTMNWQTLLSSLIAMAAVGGFVWAIRIVVSVAMGMEAMGFGDVTLMAMVGAFLGWQAGIMSFFAAPFVSFFLIIAIVLLTGSNQVPFGPMLCMGTAVVAVQWDPVWNTAGQYFKLGPIVPVGLAVLVALMGISMGFIQILKRILGYDRY